METVIQALNVMGKVTALNMLRDHEEGQEVTQSNGYWVVGKPLRARAIRAVVQPSVKVTVNDLARLLAEHGPKSSAELAALARIESKRVAPMLTYHLAKGKILREKIDGKFVYSVRSEKPAAAVPKEPVIENKERELAPAVPALTDADKPLEQFVSEIPAFTDGCSAGQVIPTVRVISREIRRTKNKLASLEKLRDAVRVVGRHKNLVNQLVNPEALNGQS